MALETGEKALRDGGEAKRGHSMKSRVPKAGTVQPPSAVLAGKAGAAGGHPMI